MEVAAAVSSHGAKQFHGKKGDKPREMKGHMAKKAGEMLKKAAENAQRMAGHSENAGDRAAAHAQRHAADAAPRIHSMIRKGQHAEALVQTHAAALGAVEAVREHAEATTDLAVRESHKLGKFIARITNQLEDSGLADSGSFLENAKNGSIWFKGYYVNLGAVLMSLVLMKSLKYVVKVASDEEDEKISTDHLTDWIKGEGQTYFNANTAMAPALGVFSRADYTNAGTLGARVVLSDKTRDAVVARLPKAEDIDVNAYYNVLIGIYSLQAHEIVTLPLQLAGSEIVNTAMVKLLTADQIGTENATSAFILETNLSDTAVNKIGTILMADKVQTVSEKIRISGALDLAGAIKTAGVVVAAGLQPWVGLIYPFFANTIGNFITKEKLVDFIGKSE